MAKLCGMLPCGQKVRGGAMWRIVRGGAARAKVIGGALRAKVLDDVSAAVSEKSATMRQKRINQSR